MRQVVDNPVEQQMILQQLHDESGIKDGKVLINRLQINTSGIIYTQRSSLINNHIRSVSAVTLFDLQRHYTLPG